MNATEKRIADLLAAMQQARIDNIATALKVAASLDRAKAHPPCR